MTKFFPFSIKYLADIHDLFYVGNQTMAKSDSKVALIQNYLERNPTATWKVAKTELDEHGITGSYFSIQKSKWKSGGTPKKKTARAAAKGKIKRTAVVGRPPKVKTADNSLGYAVEFARSVGGIDSAKELLNQLASMQVK